MPKPENLQSWKVIVIPFSDRLSQLVKLHGSVWTTNGVPEDKKIKIISIKIQGSKLAQTATWVTASDCRLEVM